MEIESIQEQLVELLSLNQITIREGHFGGLGGGICKIKKENVLFLDLDAGSYEAAFLCGRAVIQFVSDLDTIYLKPAIRDFLDMVEKKD